MSRELTGALVGWDQNGDIPAFIVVIIPGWH
jgi:hypothetical protein